MKIKINGKIIDQVESVKYLGIVFQHNLCVLKDIERAQSSFLRQFYGFFSKFSNANLQLRLRLFNMYCTSFYGSSLWSDLSGASRAYKAIGISYHKAIKKILRVPYWYSNHDICNTINFKTFDNLVNLNVLKVWPKATRRRFSWQI